MKRNTTWKSRIDSSARQTLQTRGKLVGALKPEPETAQWPQRLAIPKSRFLQMTK
jgi:hypothetical protein